MDTGLKNKIVIVTGGASGIGRASVLKFSEEGAVPVFIDKDRKKGIELYNILKKMGRERLFIHADLTNDSKCKGSVYETIRKYGKLDVLVNNAGKNDNLDIDTTSPKEFRESLDRNLVQYYAMTHFSWPQLKRTKGNVIFLGSKVSLVGEGKTTAYAAAKGAINGMTRELATKSDNESLSIRVNCVIPAIVSTPLYVKAMTERYGSLKRANRLFGSRVPLHARETTPEEIANEIVFLASNLLSSHTSGQIRLVDGNWVYGDRNIRRP